MAVRFEGSYEVTAEGYPDPLGKILEVDPGDWLFMPYPDQSMTQSILREVAEMIDKLEESGPVLVDRLRKEYEGDIDT